MNIKKYIFGVVAAISVSMGFPMQAAAKENVNIGICVSWPGYAHVRSCKSEKSCA
jgi:hypothetical protein